MFLSLLAVGFVNASCLPPRIIAGFIDVVLVVQGLGSCAPLAVLVCCLFTLVCFGKVQVWQHLWWTGTPGPIVVSGGGCRECTTFSDTAENIGNS